MRTAIARFLGACETGCYKMYDKVTGTFKCIRCE